MFLVEAVAARSFQWSSEVVFDFKLSLIKIKFDCAPVFPVESRSLAEHAEQGHCI